MKLTIDNNDGAGARDYTSVLDSERPPRVTRLLNRPGGLRAWLYAPGAEFVVPVTGARVVLARNDGTKVFTGYVCKAPDYEYLGWGERGPAYRYALRASSDESRLEAKALAPRADFVHRSAGEVLRSIANDLAPGAFNTGACEELGMLPAYAADP